MKQIMRTIALGVICCLATTSIVRADNPDKPFWKDVQTVAVNREKPRSAFMSYADRQTALMGRYEKSPYYSLLN